MEIAFKQSDVFGDHLRRAADDLFFLRIVNQGQTGDFGGSEKDDDAVDRFLEILLAGPAGESTAVSVGEVNVSGSERLFWVDADNEILLLAVEKNKDKEKDGTESD